MYIDTRKLQLKHSHIVACRLGVTLVELLVVVGLMGFLAGMTMFALRGAQDDARVARTRGTITKLNDVILQQWEEYRYRAVDMRLESARSVPVFNFSRVPPRIQAHLRVLVLRDMMRMEMPDRIEDLLFAPAHYSSPFQVGGNPGLLYLNDRVYPHKFGLIYQTMGSAIANSNWNGQIGLLSLPLNGVESSPIGQEPRSLFSGSLDTWREAVQPSELLYMIIASSTFGGSSALELFRPSEIGDTDDDGLLEFIDAWQNAIHWIRWPAGYPSDLNRYANTDAMDPLRTDWRYSDSNWPESNRPQTIVPLVVSAGGDGEFGVTFGFSDNAGLVKPVIYARMRQSGANSRFYPDPFFTWDYQSGEPNGANSAQPYDEAHVKGYRANQLGSIPNFLEDGSTRNEFAADNVTNHDILLGL